NGEPENTPWRIVGLVDDTALTYDPDVPTGPRQVFAGQEVVVRSAAPFVVSSQDKAHPFYMAGYMTGGNVEENGVGDPEMVNVVASDQYLDSYTVFSDDTYTNTRFTLVRARSGGRFHDVELDCAGVVTGFQPIGESGQYESTVVELVHMGQPQTFA